MVKYESKPQFDINSNRYPQVLFSESDFSYIQRLQKTINSLVAKPPHQYHRDTILILMNINIQKMSYGIIQTYVQSTDHSPVQLLFKCCASALRVLC